MNNTSRVNHLTILQEPTSREFIEDLLCTYWDISELPSEWLSTILNILSLYAEEPEFALQIVQETYPDLTQRDSHFYEKYQQARRAKFCNYSQYLSAYITGTILADIGGEDSKLVDELIRLNANIEKAFVTDINPTKQASQNSKVQFIHQTSPETTSIPLDSVDTVIMSTLLHHIDPPVRIKLLAHVVDILKRDGRIILIEDSFSQAPQPSDFRTPLDKRFLVMNDDIKYKILGFFDWWGNRLLKQSRTIPIPATFRSMEQWEFLFGELGCRLVDKFYLGISEVHAHVMAPKVIMVFEKTDEHRARRVHDTGDANPPSIARAEYNNEILAFVPQKGLNINLSVGATKIQTAIVDSNGRKLIQLDELIWKRNQGNRTRSTVSSAEYPRRRLLVCLVEQISQAIETLRKTQPNAVDIEGIGIAWAGPVKTNGRLIGPNIEGFRVRDLKPEEQEKGGIDLASALRIALVNALGGYNGNIAICNDGDAAAIANFRQAHLDNGLLLTIGTGLGSGILMNGKIVYSLDNFDDRMGEIGHHILFHPREHRYFYYGRLTEGKILFEMTPHSLSERTASPGLARRFLARLKRETGGDLEAAKIYLNSCQAKSGICFSEVELAACTENPTDLGPFTEKKVLTFVTLKAHEKDAAAWSFIEEMGFEIGLGVGTFVKEFENERFVNNIILSGSLGKHFGYGLKNEHGDDLFLSSMRRGIALTLQRHDPASNTRLLKTMLESPADSQVFSPPRIKKEGG